MCQLLYRNSETERLDLNNVEWQLAWKRNFSIHALETPPPITHFLVSSSEHQAKGYADDILITTTPERQLADNHCSSISLELRPDKCAAYSKGVPFNAI